jgi:FMN reductase
MTPERFSPLRVAAISGSPKESSRSRRLLDGLLANYPSRDVICARIDLGRLEADDLLGRTRSLAIADVLDSVYEADILAVSTPVYGASYSGLLKVFFDLFPAEALAGKVAVAVAAGGSPAHQLVLEHALRPLLASLGTFVVPTLTYASEAQVLEGLDDNIVRRLARGADESMNLARAMSRIVPGAATPVVRLTAAG